MTCRNRIELHPLLTGFYLLVLVCCSTPGTPDGSMVGVPIGLAKARTERISDIQYDLSFSIPLAAAEPIRGHATIRFLLKEKDRPLVIDFRNPREQVVAVAVNEEASDFTISRGQIILAADLLREGPNSVAISFVAGDGPLNRRENLMYTLFVPDRASEAFPCFDQPDLKARFSLSLMIPPSWTAVSNGLELSEVLTGASKRVQFAPTQPISTYLFAFAAGEFRTEEVSGSNMRMFYCETDATKVARNIADVFALHQTSLEWMEGYSGIVYPFGKFDFVLIPAFQFGGMEHPGAIFYRDTRLLLEESATLSDLLARANIIAHETSHMWFGDLVTMRWFDDVWLKEVFAGFMASKIVNPSFPEIDHALRFLVEHYPPAYSVERSEGTHPIRQRLDNLNDSASLYGSLIYHKAPIVMRQLELMIGPDSFRRGLQEYLNRFEFSNADWLDLISILDREAPQDLRQWSRVWVEEPGRPTIRVESDTNFDGPLLLRQEDPGGNGRVWPQQLVPLVSGSEGLEYFPLDFSLPVQELPGQKGLHFVLPNGRGLGYALFQLDPRSRSSLLTELPSIEDDVSRASAWLTLWDGLLESQVGPSDFFRLALRALPTEEVELITQRILGYVIPTYWRFLSPKEQGLVAVELENTLWQGVLRSQKASLRVSYFKAFQSIATTDSALTTLSSLWRKETEVEDLPLSERDYMRLALELAIREVEFRQEILDQQLARIENPENRERFKYLLPSVSADQQVREDFFQSLTYPESRLREPWVLEGLAYLHHPLRAEDSLHLIQPGLDLLEEIRRTGTIFFPKNWLDAILNGHNSPEAARVVRRFLDSHPQYPSRLKEKILQSADLLFRSSGLHNPSL